MLDRRAGSQRSRAVMAAGIGADRGRGHPRKPQRRPLAPGADRRVSARLPGGLAGLVGLWLALRGDGRAVRLPADALDSHPRPDRAGPARYRRDDGCRPRRPPLAASPDPRRGAGEGADGTGRPPVPRRQLTSGPPSDTSNRSSPTPTGRPPASAWRRSPWFGASIRRAPTGSARPRPPSRDGSPRRATCQRSSPSRPSTPATSRSSKPTSRPSPRTATAGSSWVRLWYLSGRSQKAADVFLRLTDRREAPRPRRLKDEGLPRVSTFVGWVAADRRRGPPVGGP